MKPMTTGASAAATAAFLGVLLAAQGNPCAAQTLPATVLGQQSAVTPIQPPILHVAKLRDAGGLPRPSRRGDEPLNARLTVALDAYFRKQAQGRYLVDHKPGKGEIATRRLTLEGDLSHVASPTLDGGGYLCVLRLYQEGGKPRRLVAQWSGTADTLRYLTGNLRADNRVDSQGLIGEMGKRVAGWLAVTSGMDQAAAFETLVKSALRSERDVTAVVLPEAVVASTTAGGASAAAAASRTKGSDVPAVVVAGGGYRLKVASRQPGTVYVVQMAGPDRLPHAAFVPDGTTAAAAGAAAAAEVRAAGEPIVLPAQEPLRAEEKVAADGGEDREIVVLVRRKKAGVSPVSGDTASAASAFPAVSGAVSINTGLPGSGAPVGVLEGMRNRSCPADPGMSRLLRWMASDPPGTWMARRVTLHVSPRPAGAPTPPASPTPARPAEEAPPVGGVTAP